MKKVNVTEILPVLNILFESVKRIMVLIDMLRKGKIDPKLVDINKWNDALEALEKLETK